MILVYLLNIVIYEVEDYFYKYLVNFKFIHLKQIDIKNTKVISN